MKALRNIVDKIKPNFEKGGRMAMFHSTFEAFETMMFVPNKVTNKGSHIRDAVDLKRTMFVVIVALTPALLFGMWNVGYQNALSTGGNLEFWSIFLFGFLKVFPIIVVSYVVGLGIEFAFAQVRKHEVNEGYLVTGMLIPLIVPVDIPLWMVALASAFTVVIGKEVFGGTGMNIFNPALIARAFLFFAYPSHMSGDYVWVANLSKGEGIVDGFSGATPLANAAAYQIDKMPSAMEMFIGTIPGSIGETSTLAILLGALILIITGIGSWKIILSTVLGGLTMGFIFNAFCTKPFMQIPSWHHLIMGGFAFGAVFMATDPVTASQTEKGKWIYGFLIGLFAVLVRVVNPAYPEGMMLSILLMNSFSPLIDHYVVEATIKKMKKSAAKSAQNSKNTRAMNKQSNLYIFLYSSVMVIVVAALLSLASTALKPYQQKNIETEKRLDILKSVGRAQDVASAKSKHEYVGNEFNKVIVEQIVVNQKGDMVEGVNPFTINLKVEFAKPAQEQNLPVFVAQMDDGSLKYIIPLLGRGLWGPIWGYISLNDDFNTVYGA